MRDTSMIRGSTFVLLSLVTICGLGCAMCGGPNLYTYPTYGGKVQRSDPENGRVGSIFSDPTDSGEYSNSQLEPTPAPADDHLGPTPVEELEKPQAKPRQAPARSDAGRSRTTNGWR